MICFSSLLTKLTIFSIAYVGLEGDCLRNGLSKGPAIFQNLPGTYLGSSVSQVDNKFLTQVLSHWQKNKTKKTNYIFYLNTDVSHSCY